MIRWVMLGLLLLTAPALAHKQSDSYLRLHPDGARIAVQWDIALVDLETVLSLDADGDGAITWGEVRARKAAIAAHALARLGIAADGAPCRFGPVALSTDAHSDGGYAVLLFDALCPAAPRRLQLTYRLLFDTDPQHRGLLAVVQPGGTFTVVLSPQTPHAEIAIGSGGGAVFGKYFADGVTHLLTGFDHLFFVAVLLLPAMLRREGRGWLPVGTFREGFWRTAAVLSAFSVAHTLTVALAALGIVTPPSRIIEAAIALTVALSAVDLVVPFLGPRRWLVAGSFGLIHGFGFANALGPLALPPASLAVALFAFNLGVEAGQLLIAVIVLPLAWALRGWRPYLRVVLPAGSALAAFVAGLWFAERAFDLPSPFL
jgi:hypothetical protein